MSDPYKGKLTYLKRSLTMIENVVVRGPGLTIDASRVRLPELEKVFSDFEALAIEHIPDNEEEQEEWFTMIDVQKNKYLKCKQVLMKTLQRKETNESIMSQMSYTQVLCRSNNYVAIVRLNNKCVYYVNLTLF